MAGDPRTSRFEQPLTSRQVRTLHSLIHRLCEGVATSEETEQLRSYLHESDEARFVYVELMYLDIAVRGWARLASEASKHTQASASNACQWFALQLPDDEADAVSLPGSTANVVRTGRGDSSRSRATAPALAAACLLLIAGVLFAGKTVRRDLASQWGGGATSHTERREGLTPIPPLKPVSAQYVAQVVNATEDVRWGHQSAPFDFGLRLGVGERLAIESGLVEVQFFSGAVLLLQGPVSFTPSGHTSGHLAYGRATGRVVSTDATGFQLTTPGAEVVDPGTEFGVAVGDDVHTEMCVFEGEAQVSANPASPVPSTPIRLARGMSLRMSADGVADLESKVDANQFARTFPPRSYSAIGPNEFSLIDAIISGVGGSHRLYNALDPNTGKMDEQPLRGARMADSVGFHFAVYNEFVDGLFIPHRGGRATRIDSYGNAIDFADNLSRTEGPIWARRPLPAWSHESAANTAAREENWGSGATRNVWERLAACKMGVVGMHSNVGISFNAHAIQSVEGRAVSAFRCKVANLDSTRGTRTNCNGSLGSVADVRIYVDGVERMTLSGLGWNDGDRHVEIDLGAHSRIVTVAITDGDQCVEHDEVVLIDPVLVFSE